MSKAWGFLALVLVVGCGNKREERKREPIVREIEIDPPQLPEAVKPEVAVDPIPDPPQPAVEPKAECVDESPLVSFDPVKLRACFDTNNDDSADRCVTWRRDGKVLKIDSLFDVEDSDAHPVTEPPIEFRSDEENNDDERISLDGSTIDICPFDRTCIKMMPKVDGGEVNRVLTDPDFKRAVVVIKNEDNKGIFEIWDLVAGRVRTRNVMKRLLEDETYDFSAHLGSGAVFAIADDSNGRSLGTIFGTDGSFRGELAQGSRNLDKDLTFMNAGTFGIVDVGPFDSEDKPYILYLHSTATGGGAGKLTIKKVEANNGLELQTLKNGFVAATQWGSEVRIDMIDLRSRTDRVLLVPGC